ncbi:MAG: threonine aldolase family protein [Formosimonas sp.]
MHPRLQPLTPPACSFSSDNSAGAHPAAMQAMLDANTGHALAYGADAHTEQTQARFKALFGAASETFLVWGGTGANVMALASLLQAGECVVCSDKAHIALDETGAPERALGAKLLMLPTPDGKIVPEQIAALGSLVGVQHHAQPGVLSLTQATELGTLYSADEIRALVVEARKLGMRVHLDGARIANATAALGGTLDALRSFTVDAGVDVVCFGGTKAGLAFGEAVVYLNPEHARRAKYVRKQVNQLPSKMRFVAAQFNALLTDNLWIDLAQHANAMAQRLYEATRTINGVHFPHAPAINGLFPILPASSIVPLSEWCHFWPWNERIHQVRWMTAWDTQAADVDAFAVGLKALLA